MYFLMPKTFKTLLALLSWGMVMAFSLPASAQTKSHLDLPAETASNEQSLSVIFEPPTDDRADDSRGGASRTAVKCRDDIASATLPEQIREIPLTALMPENNRGLTIASHPSFFVYIPTTSARQIYFSLKDANNRGIYQATLPISGNAGVVQISLPQEQNPLEIGQTYQWSVGLMCQRTQTDMPWVTGKIERIQLEANLASQLSPTPSLQQAVLYGQSGLWYDLLSTLFQLNKSAGLDNLSATDSNLLNQNWSNLLGSVGLNAIAHEPLL